MSGSAVQQADNPQEHYRSDNRSYEAANNASGAYSEQSEQPSAKHSADYPDNEIDNHAKTTSTHKFACDETCHNTDNDIPNEIHKIVELRIIIHY